MFISSGQWRGLDFAFCVNSADSATASCLTKGQIAFDFGKFWFKGQKMGTGQCNVKAHNRRLMDLIHHGKANPSLIISHELPLDEAPEAYWHFDQREHGWTKVILHPHAIMNEC